jgi:hypothetical protein
LTGRAILADAAGAVDRDLETRVRASRSWRDDYLGVLRELTSASAERDSSLAIARAGLASMRTRLTFERGSRVVNLDDALDAFEPSLTLGTGEILGTAPAVRVLRVPYRGRQLEGSALSQQLERWTEAGVIEQSFADAVRRVAEHPDWLSLPGRRVALVGAGAAIGPLEPLCSWGADVVAIDLPQRELWERIAKLARQGAGSLRMPLTADGSAGVDLLYLLPEARVWLEQTTAADELVLGMYAYADGGDHVRVTGAFDALATDVLQRRPSTTLSFLATPTDAFVVPEEVVARSRAAYDKRRLRRILQAPAKGLSGNRLFVAAYRDAIPVADALVKQQGSNYAIAKRLQRWRGVVTNAAGGRVSFNVAPATWTRSVTKNRILAAAYAGAHYFGIEIFEPSTTRVLMAALLVHDLHQPPLPRQDPEGLFSDAAAHGGLWSAAYEPRSALGIAALAGLPRALFAAKHLPASAGNATAEV